MFSNVKIITTAGHTQLIMNNVSLAQAGEYQCRAENNYGCGQYVCMLRISKPGRQLLAKAITHACVLLKAKRTRPFTSPTSRRSRTSTKPYTPTCRFVARRTIRRPQ